MFHQKIDLYQECNVPRGNAKKGTLTAYISEEITEIKPKIRPAILVIPGGGYMMCSEREGEPIALRFVTNGYAAFVLDYEVNTKHPTPLLQAAMAMKYLREHAEELRIDPDHIAAIGFSAGGHLLGTLCLRSDDEAVRSALGNVNVKPNAAVYSYAVISMEHTTTHSSTRGVISGGDHNLAEYLSLEKAVTESAPPSFIWTTADDALVPCENSVLLASACAKQGVPYELHVFSHGRHGLALANTEVNDSYDTEGNLPEIAVWFSLAVTFLKNRGFEVVTKG
ncbi:MAG: alpha/beta hydrolase [Clostridiales bacterium]|nr:alpha/beta hydrolase [Clostridiales bacterium]